MTAERTPRPDALSRVRESRLPDSLSRLRERDGVRVRVLRANATDAEAQLWRRLRGRQLDGHKFRRQHPIGSFIADFACIEACLIVELDGGQHFEPEAIERDVCRTAALQQAGFAVLRFDNRQVLQETEAVLASILQWLHKNHPHPNPLPQAGEGAGNAPLPQAGEGAKDTPLAHAGAHDTTEVS